MKRNTIRFSVLLPAAALCAALALQGCSILGKVRDAAANVSPAASGQVRPGAGSGSGVPTDTSAPASGQSDAADWNAFAADFTTVDKNPLNESIQYALWYAAQHPEEAGAEAGGASGELEKLAGKYAETVAGQGIHYVEISDALGMQIKTEVWVKGAKYMKRVELLNEVTLFDEKNYIKYDTEQKTGTRYAASYGSAEGTMLTKSMLTGLAYSSPQRKPDETVGAYECSVYFFDIEVLGFKGETVYVDKATGMIVKTQIGDPKDKNSMATVIDSLEVGGFGDEVFIVPEGIAISDYASAS